MTKYYEWKFFWKLFISIFDVQNFVKIQVLSKKLLHFKWRSLNRCIQTFGRWCIYIYIYICNGLRHCACLRIIGWLVSLQCLNSFVVARLVIYFLCVVARLSIWVDLSRDLIFTRAVQTLIYNLFSGWPKGVDVECRLVSKLEFGFCDFKFKILMRFEKVRHFA